jgi:hypothetical protein
LKVCIGILPMQFLTEYVRSSFDGERAVPQELVAQDTADLVRLSYEPRMSVRAAAMMTFIPLQY